MEQKNQTAFSNPIYGQFDDNDDRKKSSTSASYRPIPKPRLSITKSKQQQQQQQQQRKQDDRNRDNSEQMLNQQTTSPSSILHGTFGDNSKRSSSLCLGDIRMTQLLEEIYSLTDSLQKNFSSVPDNVDDSGKQMKDGNGNGNGEKNEVPRRIAKRKRIPLKSELLKMSFSQEDGNDITPSADVKTDDTRSGDSGVFLMASQKSINDDNRIDNKNNNGQLEEPPKLPPRKPLRLDIVPKMDPVKTFEEHLLVEHLHNDTLSLQRSGYLWKTGPDYKSFKNRWCVLYRHSQNYFDANVSYYFNRSSMSASLSGKILLAEIEFISVTETIPTKTRLPRIEKKTYSISSTSSGASLSISDTAMDSNHSNNNNNNQSLCFFEIGVKSRQGRVYLFAARSDSDRQLWIHAFVQAITLHAFKNKEIYHCGFIRARFTITAKWQTCFAILTTDRFFYVFEMEQDNPIPTLDCKQYHIFNLRKTVRLCRLDESTVGNEANNVRKSTDSFKESCSIDCKFGFSLTQNGGHVVYLISVFESHINLWYRSIWKFWITPRQPVEKLILEEQYLTKENIPVGFDKCLKFLDTFNQTCLNLFGPMQDSIHETVISRDTAEKPNELTKHQRPSPNRSVTSPNILPADMDLRSQQNLLTQLRFDSWNVHLLPQKYNACQISQLLLLYLRSMNECIFSEVLLAYWIKLSSVAENVNLQPNTSNNDPNSWTNLKNEQMKRLLKLMPPVNYATLRRFIIYLSNATHKNEEYQLSTSLCKTLLFSKSTNKTLIPVSLARSLLMSLIQNHVWLFDVTKEELEKELHIKRVVNLIISQNRKENAKKQSVNHMNLIRSHTNDHLINNSKHDGQRVNSLIIGIKVSVLPDNQQTTVNVHINRNTTANQIFEMILEKVKLNDNENKLKNYSVFEVVCNRRLERIIMGKERILPLVLCWSNWPSHWSMEACIEIKPTEHLLKGQDKKIKLPNLNVIRFENESLNYSPTMLMSVIQYGGQSDTRLVKHILAEFSSSQLFLYCKETHHLLGQYGLDDIYWYVGAESANLFQCPPVRCSTIVHDDDESGVIVSSGSNKMRAMKRGQQQSGSNAPGSSSIQQLSMQTDYGIPALTFIERTKIKSRQSPERKNFGQTLVFNSWTELDQWIKGLLEASFHKELFDI